MLCINIYVILILYKVVAYMNHKLIILEVLKVCKGLKPDFLHTETRVKFKRLQLYLKKFKRILHVRKNTELNLKDRQLRQDIYSAGERIVAEYRRRLLTEWRRADCHNP